MNEHANNMILKDDIFIWADEYHKVVHFTLKYGYKKLLKKLLKLDVPIKQEAICTACMYGRTKIIKCLIKNNIPIHKEAIYSANLYGHKVISTLIKEYLEKNPLLDASLPSYINKQGDK